jgi:hypothetical protein
VDESRTAEHQCRSEPGKTGLSQWVQAGPEWKRYTFTTNVPFMPYTKLRVLVREQKEANTLWLDGAMVEEKAEASSEYSSPFPVEMALSLPNPGHVVFDNQSAVVGTKHSGTLPRGAQLKMSIIDLAGKTRVPFSISLPASSFALPNLNGRRGMWKLRAQIVDAQNKALSAPAELIWARLPRPRDSIHATLFSAHIFSSRPITSRWRVPSVCAACACTTRPCWANGPLPKWSRGSFVFTMTA